MMGLVYFYNNIGVENVSREVLMKLDIAGLKLAFTAGSYVQMLPKVKQDADRIEAVRKGKYQQGKKTSDIILEAYEDLGVKYDPNNEKKPFKFAGECYSFNKFANQLKVQQGIDPDPKQIVMHLKRLIDDGSI